MPEIPFLGSPRLLNTLLILAFAADGVAPSNSREDCTAVMPPACETKQSQGILL